MTDLHPLELTRINPVDFDVTSLDDEIRVDTLCVRLLLAIRDHLLLSDNVEPRTIGGYCQAADYFLREFIIAECADNLFLLPPERIGQFAGHWYIIRSLEPNIRELADILAGTAACYKVLGDLNLVESHRVAAITAACADLPTYNRRIEEFWAITDDGFDGWRAACPLPSRLS